MSTQDQQIPDVDASEGPGDTGSKPENVADASDDGNGTTDDPIASARAERDAAKEKRRAAEARAESLEAELAELKQQAERLEAIEAENESLQAARAEQRHQQTTSDIAAGLDPALGDVVARGLALALAERGTVDLEADDAAQAVLDYVRDAHPGMVRKDTGGHRGQASSTTTGPRWKSSAI